MVVENKGLELGIVLGKESSEEIRGGIGEKAGRKERKGWVTYSGGPRGCMLSGMGVAMWRGDALDGTTRQL